MAGLRPYEDFGWFEEQGPAVGMSQIITQDRYNQEPVQQLQQTEWNAPVAGAEGGALFNTFGNYRMTPESPSVSESNHWEYYQPEMQADDEGAPPVVDPTQDPAGALAASTMVRATTGGGPGLVKPRPVPKPGMVAREAQEAEGKQVLFDQNKIPKWQDSRAFGAGLLSFGLNLLSGNDLATAFNQAGSHFEKEFGREKRELWAQDLMDQGYDAHEVQAWIVSGDHKALSNPMQKKMQQQQFQLGQMQLQKAMYENSPEMLEWQAGKEQRAEERAEEQLALSKTGMQAQLAQQARANDLAERKFAYEVDKAKAKAAADAAKGGKFSAEEHKNRMYATRGVQGLKNYNQTVKDVGLTGYNPQTLASDFADAATIEGVFSGNQVAETAARRANPRLASMISAERAFLAPILRVESGAAISNMEWKTSGEQFFPRPGDSPQRIAQKAQLRDIAVASMNPSASPELQQTLELYSAGGLEGFKMVNGQAYASEDGKSWYKVPMYK